MLRGYRWNHEREAILAAADGDELRLDDSDPRVEKVAWAQQEALVLCRMVMEHGDEDERAWASAWHSRIDHYMQARFRLEPDGFEGYKVGGDRECRFRPDYAMGYAHTPSRKENYHTGREHMLAIEWLDRTAGPRRPPTSE